jgi:signal transduction histidine kinase
MTTSESRPRAAPVDGELLARLAAHRTLAGAPREELEWLVAHGQMQYWKAGDLAARKGQEVEGMFIILEGHVSHLTDHTGTWRKVMDWRGGEVTGYLPYSRMGKAPGNSVVEEPTEALMLPKEMLPDMPVVCPHVTAALVHVMVDRARTFKSRDLQDEKMASLGKLAAGLAHELNNPASAAARGAKLVRQALAESDGASRALGAAHLGANELALLDRVRIACGDAPTTSVRSVIERADREADIAAWLDDHGAEDSLSDALADTDVTIGLLDELAGALSGDKLNAALRWVAAGCSVRALARDIERAASRVHELVSAIKGVTYMDHATVPEAVDLAKGLTDTLAVLAAKARSRSASLAVDVPADLPRARGFGGELNQVWLNLLDNAIDAVKEGGHVDVTARAAGGMIVVRVTDDGPGIPENVKSRIFDPFFTTKPVGQGTGLGLDIVRQVLEHNSGRVDFESEPGRTEFRVTLQPWSDAQAGSTKTDAVEV